VLILGLGFTIGCASTPAPRPSGASGPAAASQAASAEPAAPAAPAEEPRAPDAIATGLVFAVAPQEAQISIDGSPRGAVADLSSRGGLLPLAPGIYQVSLKAPGYATWRAEVALRTGTETIRVNLARKP
jgi:hypothetical protein